MLIKIFLLLNYWKSLSIKQGTIIGTPPYMALEQFNGTVSKEGEQYGLGCIAYELFTGRQPHTAPDLFAMAYKHLNEQQYA
jgi:serine/threonine protein kinase